MESFTFIFNLYQNQLPYPIIIATIVLLSFFFLLSKPKRNLPPGPTPIPILGNLHLIKPPVHRTFHKLSQKHGPVLSLRFGSRFVTVVTSSSIAEECFSKNDAVLANRPKFLAGKHIGYNYSNMVNAPYGDHYRNLRRICTVDNFSSARLSFFQRIRKDEVNRMLNKLCSCSEVEVRPVLTQLTFNNVMRMVSAKRFDVDDDGEARVFRDLVAEILEVSQTSNPVDFLPILQLISYGDYEKELIKLGKRIDEFLQNLINEYRRKEDDLNETGNTMIDHLLYLQKSQPEYYTEEIIKGLILVLFVAGTDTTALTVEWAMAELLNNPNILQKARSEIDGQIGNKRLIDEQDLPKLKYLQSIILETLRLHPVVPLLLPHLPSEDCEIGGYTVPRDTIVFINTWAIHRDPSLWADPTRFSPERFENGEDQARKILSFGMGRRACPGAGLAHRSMGLVLGSLIQCFDWERIGGVEVDMSEGGGGLTMVMEQPLKAMCKARQDLVDLMIYID